MSNRYWSRNRYSERVTLQDVMKNRKAKSQRIKVPLTEKEKRELEEHLAKKKLLLYDGDLDRFKEDK